MTTKSSSVERKSKKITISVDFDGVIRDILTGQPVAGVERALDWLYRKNIDIVVSTANSDLEFVKSWMFEHGLDYPVTDKKVAATMYVDDRAVRFTNWNDITSYF